jgi:ABC-type Na+ transport system ATPase subunit NatA
MPNNPVEGLQNVPLHLCEHLVVVQGATHGLQLSYSRYPVLLITVLGSNEEGGATDKLIVALVDDTAGAVAVEEVDSKKQSFRQQLEGGVSFNQEVKEVGTHEPLDLSLNVD